MKKWVIDNVITPIVLATAFAAYRRVSHEASDAKKLSGARSIRQAAQDNNYHEEQS